MEKLLIAKQASDLHTPFLNQLILHRYLPDHEIDEHITRICDRCGSLCQIMLDALRKAFPDDCRYTQPEGGMFLGMTLPESVHSMDLFDAAIKENVAFVPGNPFYFDERHTKTLRLNFTNSAPDDIEEGVRRMASCYRNLSDQIAL